MRPNPRDAAGDHCALAVHGQAISEPLSTA